MFNDADDITHCIGDVPFVVINEEKVEERLVDELAKYFEKLSVKATNVDTDVDENDVSNVSSIALKRRNNSDDDDDNDDEPKTKKMREEEYSFCIIS